MLYSFVLFMHIGVALATLGTVAWALYAIVGEDTLRYRPLAVAIAALALFEVASGTMLAVMAASGLAALVSHIAAYLIVCIGVEVLIIERMRSASWAS